MKMLTKAVSRQDLNQWHQSCFPDETQLQRLIPTAGRNDNTWVSAASVIALSLSTVVWWLSSTVLCDDCCYDMLRKWRYNPVVLIAILVDEVPELGG